MNTTIYTLNDVQTQVILPQNFGIKIVDKKKKSIDEENFATGGFWAPMGDGSTFPVGNLIVDGKVISNAATNPDWINVSKKILTTLFVGNDNGVHIDWVQDISKCNGVKYAISGIPILHNGYAVSRECVLKEGYTGGELYNTWHNFLGIRDGKIVLVGAKCTYAQMPFLMEVLGLNDAIKLDGGGSWIMHSMDFTKATAENRRIHNVITW